MELKLFEMKEKKFYLHISDFGNIDGTDVIDGINLLDGST